MGKDVFIMGKHVYLYWYIKDLKEVGNLFIEHTKFTKLGDRVFPKLERIDSLRYWQVPPFLFSSLFFVIYPTAQMYLEHSLGVTTAHLLDVEEILMV